MRNAALALLLLLLAAPALAQDPDDYNRYLIPVSTREIRGANGSIWRAEWTVHNFRFNSFDMIWNHCPPNVSPCPSTTIPALTTVHPALVPRDNSDGGFAYIPKSDDPLVGMSLRVRELSENAGNFGTEIPIVGMDEYTSAERPAIFLLDIPTDPKYRATLRIYGPTEAPTTAMVSVYVEGESSFIEQYRVDLAGIVTVLPVDFPLNPAYAQLDPLTPAVRASGDRVRIVVNTGPEIRPIWAMLTLINNDTQQVTTVTHTK